MLDHDQLKAILIMIEYGIGIFFAVVAVGALVFILIDERPAAPRPDRNLPRPKFDKDGNRMNQSIDWDVTQ